MPNFVNIFLVLVYLTHICTCVYRTYTYVYQISSYMLTITNTHLSLTHAHIHTRTYTCVCLYVYLFKRRQWNSFCLSFRWFYLVVHLDWTWSTLPFRWTVPNIYMIYDNLVYKNEKRVLYVCVTVHSFHKFNLHFLFIWFLVVCRYIYIYNICMCTSF